MEPFVMGTIVFPEECMGKMLTLCEVSLFVFPDLYNKEVTLGKSPSGTKFTRTQDWRSSF